MEREKGTKKKYESPRKENNVTWHGGEKGGGKRGAMAAALAYYARRERRRRMFLKHVRHALTTVHWPSYDVTTTLSPSLLLSCFFFSLSFSTTLYLSRGDSCPPWRIIERGQRPVGSVHVSRMHGGTCNCSIYDPCIDTMNFFRSFSILWIGDTSIYWSIRRTIVWYR